jgi:hypothetical protein
VAQTNAGAISIPPAAVSADTALRLARFFGTSDRFWLRSKVIPPIEDHPTPGGIAHDA